MSGAARNAVAKVEWSKLGQALKLAPSAVSALNQLRSRCVDARARLAAMETQPTELDFAHYRSVMKNQRVIDEIERTLKDFKPVTYDVKAQIGAIEQFEKVALENARETAETVNAELAELNKTLKNIEEAKPFEQLTVTDVTRIQPDIEKNVEKMVSNGRWTVPGYKEKFGDLTIM